MRLWMAVALGCASCGGTTKPGAVPTAEERALAMADACKKATWYPGATDPHAPRVTLHLLPEGVVPHPADHEPGVCLLLDGQSLLSTADQALIDSRADRRETVNWSGRVSPGDHTLGVVLSLREGIGASGRILHVDKDGTVTIGVAGERGVFAWGGTGGVTVSRMAVRE